MISLYDNNMQIMRFIFLLQESNKKIEMFKSRQVIHNVKKK